MSSLSDSVIGSPIAGAGGPFVTGELVRVSANNTVVKAQADTLANTTGYYGVVSSGSVRLGGPVNVASAGSKTKVLLETGLTPVAGQTLYISAATAGRATNASPAVPVTIGSVVDASPYATYGYVYAVVGGGGSGVSGTGAQGPQGSQGVQGTSGAQGSQGTAGAGTQGAQGAAGAQGSTGTGSQGAQGTAGVQGSQGSQGTQGAGSQGAQGNQGSTGAQGFQGPGVGSQGAQGTQGSQGPAGGAQGNQGVQGSQGLQGSTGVQGSTGAQGQQGLQGVQGSTGVQGFQGGTGSTGLQGNQGFQGTAGAQGGVGAQGVAGGPGAQGTQGGTGAQGAQGAAGTGAQGSQGGTGSQGNQGAQGAAGAGSQGAQGAAGSAGAQGSQGTAGAQGNTGAQGTSGAQGTTGAQGDAGAQGATGTGSQGSQGNQGFQGTAGGAQGSAGAQGNQGFQGTAGGAQGNQGLQGSTGVQGAQGFQGNQGLQGLTGTGAQGTQGSTGLQGTQGSTGAQGATGTGTQGATGAQGSVGAQGNQGFQGVQGSTGVQGATGVQGNQGSVGAQGSQGTAGAQGSQGSQGNQGSQGSQGSQASISYGGAPPAVASSSSAGVATTVSRSDHDHALDMVAYTPSLAGMQATGVMQQVYSAGVATPSVLAVTSGAVPFGDTDGRLTFDATGVTWDTSARTLSISRSTTGTNLKLVNSSTLPTSSALIQFSVAGVATTGLILSHATGWTSGSGTINDSAVLIGNSTKAGIVTLTAGDGMLAYTRADLGTAATVGYAWANAPDLLGTSNPQTGVPARNAEVPHMRAFAFGDYMNPGGGAQLWGYFRTYSGGVQVGNEWAYTVFDNGTAYAASQAYFLVTRATNKPTNATDLGAQTSGVLQQTVSGAAATVTSLAIAASRVPFGTVTGTSILTTSANFQYNSTTSTLALSGSGAATNPPLMLTGGNSSNEAIYLTGGATTITGSGDLIVRPSVTWYVNTGGTVRVQVDSSGNHYFNSTPYVTFSAGSPSGQANATVMQFSQQAPSQASGASKIGNVHQWDAITIPFTGNTHNTLTTGVNFAVMNGHTISHTVAGGVIDYAATLVVVAAPAAGSNTTITNKYSIWAQAGAVRFDGTNGDSIDGAIVLGRNGAQAIEKVTAGTFYIATQIATGITFVTNSTSRTNFNSDGTVVFTANVPSVAISGNNADSISSSLLFNQAHDQAINKTGGTLYVGTGDANAVLVGTNLTTRMFVDSQGYTYHTTTPYWAVTSSSSTPTPNNAETFYHNITPPSVPRTNTGLDCILFDSTTVTITGTAGNLAGEVWSYFRVAAPTFSASAGIRGLTATARFDGPVSGSIAPTSGPAGFAILADDPLGEGTANIGIYDSSCGLFVPNIIGWAGSASTLNIVMIGSNTLSFVTGAASDGTGGNTEGSLNSGIWSLGRVAAVGISTTGDVQLGGNTLAAIATHGYAYMPEIAARPTGVANAFGAGTSAFGVDLTTASGHAIYVYNQTGGQWESAPLFTSTAAAGAGAATINNLPGGVGTTAKWWVFKTATGTTTYIPYFQ